MTAPTYDLGTLHGGLRLPSRKSESTGAPILELPLPPQLVLPVEQRVGQTARPVVGVGERVLKGQVIAEPSGELGIPEHASSSGTVVAIESRPVARRHGDPAACIVIDCDGLDEALPAAPAGDYYDLPAADLLLRILDGGIAGLGGAVFPTAQKLMQAKSTDVELSLIHI